MKAPPDMMKASVWIHTMSNDKLAILLGMIVCEMDKRDSMDSTDEGIRVFLEMRRCLE